MIKNFSIPDDFWNELMRRKSATGAPAKFQILNALRKEWGWDIDCMPIDGRTVRSEKREPPAPKFAGQSPVSHPLDSNGDPIMSVPKEDDPEFQMIAVRQIEEGMRRLQEKNDELAVFSRMEPKDPGKALRDARFGAIRTFNGAVRSLGYSPVSVDDMPQEITKEADVEGYIKAGLMEGWLQKVGPEWERDMPPNPPPGRPLPDGAEAIDRLADAGNDASSLDEEPF